MSHEPEKVRVRAKKYQKRGLGFTVLSWMFYLLQKITMHYSCKVVCHIFTHYFCHREYSFLRDQLFSNILMSVKMQPVE